MEVTLYVLRLQHQKWYVGTSGDMATRMKSHWRGNGTAWTDQHKPIEIYSETIYPDRDSAEKAENELVLQMFDDGLDVRGGLWCYPSMPPNKDLRDRPNKWHRKFAKTLNDIMY